MRRPLVTAAIAAAVLVGAAAPAHAQPPRGRLGLLLGGRNGLGTLSEEYGLGAVLGFDASWEVAGGDRGGFAFHWGVLITGFDLVEGSDGASVTGDLQLLELAAGVRGRVALGTDGGRSVLFNGGVTELRSNVELLHDRDRRHTGFYVGAALENRVASWLFTTIELRYSLLGWPPGLSGVGDSGTLSALLGFAFCE